jgi:hypothetical protein
MKLYRAKVSVIAAEAVERLVAEGDVELAEGQRDEAEKDFVAIMEDYLRRDFELREEIKDYMSSRSLPYGQYGRIRSRMADARGYPLGDDVERFLVRQFVENLMISPSIEEVYGEDQAIYKKLMEVVKGHHVDEQEIRDEAQTRIKNVREGTVEFEVAMRNAVRDEKKRRGLI